MLVGNRPTEDENMEGKCMKYFLYSVLYNNNYPQQVTYFTCYV